MAIAGPNEHELSEDAGVDDFAGFLKSGVEPVVIADSYFCAGFCCGGCNDSSIPPLP